MGHNFTRDIKWRRRQRLKREDEIQNNLVDLDFKEATEEVPNCPECGSQLKLNKKGFIYCVNSKSRNRDIKKACSFQNQHLYKKLDSDEKLPYWRFCKNYENEKEPCGHEYGKCPPRPLMIPQKPVYSGSWEKDAMRIWDEDEISWEEHWANFVRAKREKYEYALGVYRRKMREWGLEPAV